MPTEDELTGSYPLYQSLLLAVYMSICILKSHKEGSSISSNLQKKRDFQRLPNK